MGRKMSTLEIENIPLEMPEKEYIFRKPSYPYEYPTHGIIRGKDFNILLNILIENYMEEQVLQAELENKLGYHAIKDIFPDWDFQELTDFCRHVLKINQMGIGWDLVDGIILELDNIAIPGWKIPNFDFVEYFQNILSQIKKLYLPERLIHKLEQVLESSKIDEIQLEQEIKQYHHLWSVRDLWLLLTYIVRIRKMNDDDDHEVLQLFNLVSSLFEEMITKGEYGVKEKVCLILLYIDGIDGINKEYTMKSKDLLDQIWDDIKELPYSEKISFKYLLGAAYSMVGQHLFRQNTDFVTRKLFIDNFIHNYVSEDYDLGRWFADLLDYEMDELIFDLLIEGYSKTVPLLHNHVQELPESKARDRVILRIKQFNIILAEILFFSLHIPEDPSDIHLVDALDLFPKLVKFDKTRLNMLELLYQVTTNSVFYNPDMSKIRKSQLYAATFYLLNVYFDEDRAVLFDLGFRINSGNYQFETLHQMIHFEVEDTGSIVLSETFEREIIGKISMAIAYSTQLNTKEPIYIELFEIILQFMLEWLAQFSDDPSDFKEVLLLFSPMITICFSNQIKWYFENGFSKKAYLMNLNLHSFMNYFSNRLDRFDKVNFDTMVLHQQKGMQEKYKELTSRWHIHDTLNQAEIKEIIIDTRGKFRDSGLYQHGNTGNLIENDIIHGYLDEVNRLENFISTDFSQKQDRKLEELLLESGIFQKGDPSSTYRLERLSYTNSDKELIPVPLFNNIHRLNIATEFFQLKISNVDEIEQRNKRIQQKFRSYTQN